MQCIRLVIFDFNILKPESVYFHLISLLIELYLRNLYKNYKAFRKESSRFKSKIIKTHRYDAQQRSCMEYPMFPRLPPLHRLSEFLFRFVALAHYIHPRKYS